MQTRARFAAALLLTVAAPALAQTPMPISAPISAPQPVAHIDTIPPPRDIAYPGTPRSNSSPTGWALKAPSSAVAATTG